MITLVCSPWSLGPTLMHSTVLAENKNQFFLFSINGGFAASTFKTFTYEYKLWVSLCRYINWNIVFDLFSRHWFGLYVDIRFDSDSLVSWPWFLADFLVDLNFNLQSLLLVLLHVGRSKQCHSRMELIDELASQLEEMKQPKDKSYFGLTCMLYFHG